MIVAALAATPANAHCFTRWYYPFPQHCGAPIRAAPRPIIPAPAPIRPAPKPIPIPPVTLADVIGGEADEDMRGRLMLHALLRKEAK